MAERIYARNRWTSVFVLVWSALRHPRTNHLLIIGPRPSGEGDKYAWETVVFATDLTEEEADYLFDRVAAAAHLLDESLCCSQRRVRITKDGEIVPFTPTPVPPPPYEPSR